jgi:hypothetical protein
VDADTGALLRKAHALKQQAVRITLGGCAQLQRCRGGQGRQVWCAQTDIGDQEVAEEYVRAKELKTAMAELVELGAHPAAAGYPQA